MEIGITVVIPYFNNSSVFQRTLDSIFNQKLQPQEVIIVDDCSDDSDVLKNIINLNKKKTNISIVYIRNKNNKNGAYCRNLGIKESRFEIIAFLDADDYWHENHLFLSINHMQMKNVDFLFSNVIEIKRNKRKVRKVSNPKLLKNVNDILFLSPPQTNSFLINRNIYIENKIFFDENLKRHQDYQFLIDSLNSGIKWDYIDINTAFYCIPEKNKGFNIDYNSMLYFWDKHYQMFTKNLVRSYILGICVDCFFYKGKSFLLNSIENKENILFVKDDPLLKYMFKFKSISGKLRLVFKFLHYIKNDKSFFIKLFK